MTESNPTPGIRDGRPVSAEQIPGAVTASEIEYDDGSLQSFDSDGTTVFTEGGRETRGEWYVDDDGRFCSFWPPSYRACYELTWIVEDGKPAGLTFTEQGRGSVFAGRYR